MKGAFRVPTEAQAAKEYHSKATLTGSISCPGYVGLAKVGARRANVASRGNDFTLNCKLQSFSFWLEVNRKEFVQTTRTDIP